MCIGKYAITVYMHLKGEQGSSWTAEALSAKLLYAVMLNW